jgi:hypothetical protein
MSPFRTTLFWIAGALVLVTILVAALPVRMIF